LHHLNRKLVKYFGYHRGGELKKGERLRNHELGEKKKKGQAISDLEKEEGRSDVKKIGSVP